MTLFILSHKAIEWKETKLFLENVEAKKDSVGKATLAKPLDMCLQRHLT